MVGLALRAFVLFEHDRLFLGSIFFCLSLGFKQMALFYALPVFFYILGKCRLMGRRGFLHVILIGLTVLTTWGLLLYPFSSSIDNILQVFKRVFPVERGLYEDKVANVWCALSVVLKLRQLFALQTLVYISIASTLLAVLPSCLVLFMNPTKNCFYYCLAAGSLGFFLFSFQVHEKSIILPGLLFALLAESEPWLALWFNNVAVYSMLPLLEKDGLVLPTCAVLVLSNTLFWEKLPTQSLVRSFLWTIHLVMIISYLARYMIEPPSRYPHIHIVWNVLLSTAQFLAVLIYTNWRLLQRTLYKTKTD